MRKDRTHAGDRRYILRLTGSSQSLSHPVLRGPDRTFPVFGNSARTDPRQAKRRHAAIPQTATRGASFPSGNGARVALARATTRADRTPGLPPFPPRRPPQSPPAPPRKITEAGGKTSAPAGSRATVAFAPFGRPLLPGAGTAGEGRAPAPPAGRVRSARPRFGSAQLPGGGSDSARHLRLSASSQRGDEVPRREGRSPQAATRREFSPRFPSSCVKARPRSV